MACEWSPGTTNTKMMHSFWQEKAALLEKGFGPAASVCYCLTLFAACKCADYTSGCIR